MYKIVVTNKNIKDVYGRLRKFFFNKHNTGFESWHNFDCGWKNIQDYQPKDWNKKLSRNLIPAPQNVEYEDKMGEPFIRINYSPMDVQLIDIGDTIAFCGNKIIFKQEWILSEYKYIYEVYQVKTISDEFKNEYFECKQEDDSWISDFEYDHFYTRKKG